MPKYLYILIIFLFPMIFAEEVLFVKGGEVEGISVGSFYLSHEKITNQDYFLFIQDDGYNKKYLWDVGVLEKFEKQFTIKSGDKAPRSWEEGNPPIGKEYEGVLKITNAEARAFAKNKGWIVPTRRMWQLAKKIDSNIGSYPWNEDYEDEENEKVIRLARYFTPGDVFEKRFEKTQKAILSFASVSQVNRNASGIRDLGRKYKTMRSSVKNMDSNLQEVLKTVSENNKQKELETLIASLSAKITELEKKQTQQIEQTMKKWQHKQDANVKKIKNLSDLVTFNTREMEALHKDSQLILAKNEKLKIQVEKLQKSMLKEKSRIDNSENVYENMRGDLSFLQQKDITIEQQLSELKKQDEYFTKDSGKLKNRIKDILGRDDLQDKDIAKLNALCQQIEKKNRRLQKDVDFLYKTDNDVSSKIKTLQTSITSQSQEDNNLWQKIETVTANFNKQKEDIIVVNQNIEQLKNKDILIDKSLKHATDLLRTESHDIRKKLFDSQQAKVKLISENSNRNATEIKGLDNYVGNMKSRLQTKIETLETELKLVEKKRNRLETDFRIAATQMRHNMLEIGQKMLKLFQNGMFLGPIPPEKEIDPKDIAKEVKKNTASQAKKNAEFTKKEKEKLKAEILATVKIENQKIEKHLQKSISQNLEQHILQIVQESVSLSIEKSMQKHVSENVSKNVVETVDKSLQESINRSVQESVERSLQESVYKSVQKSMNERLEKSVNKSVLKAMQIEKNRFVNNAGTSTGNLSKRDLAELCLNVAIVFFKNEQLELASNFTKLSLKYDNNVARDFWNQNWIELSTPKKMAYIPQKLAILGKLNDYEHPYRKKLIPAFFMDNYEVTRSEFAQFVKKGYANGNLWSSDGNRWRKNQTTPANWKMPTSQELNLPMVNVSYYEAEAYAKWQGKRLPSTEEWERAVRYSDGRLYPWGNKAPRQGKYFRANFRQIGSYKDSFIFSAPVGSFEADRSVEGIYDLCGNVSEWCFDSHQRNKTKKAIKGGSYNSTRHRLQGHYQMGENAAKGFSHVGFRCVKDSSNK